MPVLALGNPGLEMLTENWPQLSVFKRLGKAAALVLVHLQSMMVFSAGK